MLTDSDKKLYELLQFNCEHLVRWCVVGKTKCLQREEIVKQATQWAHPIGGTMGIIIKWVEKKILET